MDERKLSEQVFQIRLMATNIVRIGKRDVEQRLEAYRKGVSGQQYLLLVLLEPHPLTLRELSQQVGLEPSTLVPMVEGLVRQKLINRTRDETDRRRSPLQLTDNGCTLLETVPPAVSGDTLTRSLARMGEEKAHLLAELLQELLEQAPGETILPGTSKNG